MDHSAYLIFLFVFSESIVTLLLFCRSRVNFVIRPDKLLITLFVCLKKIIHWLYITLSTKVYIVKDIVFLVVMGRCESWTIKRLNAEEMMLLELEKPLESPLDSKEIKPVKPMNPKCSLEGLMISLKLQYYGHQMQRARRIPWCWERLKAGGEEGSKG